jgi:hypothetical protein
MNGTDLLHDLAFRRDVRAVRSLGDRVLAELLLAVVATPDRMRTLVGDFAGISPEHLHAAGGDGFPPVAVTVPRWFGGDATFSFLGFRSLRKQLSCHHSRFAIRIMYILTKLATDARCSVLAS